MPLDKKPIKGVTIDGVILDEVINWTITTKKDPTNMDDKNKKKKSDPVYKIVSKIPTSGEAIYSSGSNSSTNIWKAGSNTVATAGGGGGGGGGSNFGTATWYDDGQWKWKPGYTNYTYEITNTGLTEKQIRDIVADEFARQEQRKKLKKMKKKYLQAKNAAKNEN